MRLIDADELRQQFEDRTLEDFTCYHFLSAIDNAPTVPQVTVFAENASKEEIEDFKQELEKVLERPQGEWIFQYTFLDDNLYKCSSCDRLLSIDVEQDIAQFLFCPNCGADMRRKSNETD